MVRAVADVRTARSHVPVWRTSAPANKPVSQIFVALKLIATDVLRERCAPTAGVVKSGVAVPAAYGMAPSAPPPTIRAVAASAARAEPACA